MLRFAAPTEPWEKKGGWFFRPFSVVAICRANPWAVSAGRKDESDEGSEVEAEVEDWDSFSPTLAADCC